MDSTVRKLWLDVVRCRLLTVEESRALAKQHSESKTEPTSARQLAQQLVADRHITPYHAKALLAGHVGPFIFGDYRVNDRLPGGGHTRRFSGIHLPTKHKVLLHFCSNPDGITDEEWTAESNYLDRHRAIVDPHLDRCYETITRTKHKIAITEHVKGDTAADLLEKQQRLPIPLACDIIRQAAFGLRSLSEAGLTHGLVQPDRLVVQKTAQVRVLRDPTTIPVPIDMSAPDPKGYLQQRANYFAPELMTPERTHDMRTDVYALGCTLFELLVGHPPFAGGSIHEKMVRHSQEPIISLTDAVGASPELADAVAFMMAKNYNVRFGSFQDVIDALAPFCGPSPANRAGQFRSTELRYCEDLRLRLQQSDELSTATVGDSPKTSASSNNGLPASTDKRSIETPIAAPTRLAQSRQTGSLWIKLACGLAALAAIGTVGMVLRHLVVHPTTVTRDTSSSRSAPQHVPPASDDSGVTKPPAVSSNETREVNATDDGVSLWQSPTAGDPLKLDFLPSGVQFFGSVHFRDLLSSFEGRRVLQALGPTFQTWRKTWQAETGIDFSQIDTLVFASVAQDVGPPRSMFVVHMIDRASIDAMLHQHRTTSADGGRTWTFNNRSFLAADGRPILVVGDPDLVAAVSNNKGAPPLLRRDLELLRQASDSRRHFTIIATKNFLTADGKKIIPESRRRANRALLTLLGEQARAAMASFQFSDRAFYGELRVVSPTDANPNEVAKQLEANIESVPANVTSFLGSAPVDPYWQRLAIQIPTMTRFLTDRTRVVPDANQVIANVALPPQAAHNLVLATEIVSSLDRRTTPATQQRIVNSIDSILAHKMTMEFPQQSLESAVRDVAMLVNEQLPDANFAISIVGADLLLDGITRNQQIKDFRQSDVSVAQILTAILRMANPDPTATSSTDPKQKLVWVIDKRAGSPTILVTTRAGAAQKGYELPSAFRSD